MGWITLRRLASENRLKVTDEIGDISARARWLGQRNLSKSGRDQYKTFSPLGNSVLVEIQYAVVNFISQISKNPEEFVKRFVPGKSLDVLHGYNIRLALPDQPRELVYQPTVVISGSPGMSRERLTGGATSQSSEIRSFIDFLNVGESDVPYIGLPEVRAVVVQFVSITTGGINIQPQSNINSSRPQTMREPPYATEQIDSPNHWL